MKNDGAPDATRERVAQRLLTAGGATAGELAEALGLTPAGVRRHLQSLAEEGALDARERPASGRGRPSREYHLTETGRARFGTGYDQLAIEALEFLADSGGEEAVEAFARARVARIEARYHEIRDADDTVDASQALAQALNEHGWVASVAHAQTGEQVCQHHCPVAAVAERFPQLCRAEAEVFSRLMGSHVQRLASIPHGHDQCTTHIPFPTVRDEQTTTIGGDR